MIIILRQKATKYLQKNIIWKEDIAVKVAVAIVLMATIKKPIPSQKINYFGIIFDARKVCSKMAIWPKI